MEINNISGLQLKEAGLKRGYIQLVFPGSKENKSGVFVATQEKYSNVY